MCADPHASMAYVKGHSYRLLYKQCYAAGSAQVQQQQQQRNLNGMKDDGAEHSITRWGHWRGWAGQKHGPWLGARRGAARCGCCGCHSATWHGAARKGWCLVRLCLI